MKAYFYLRRIEKYDIYYEKLFHITEKAIFYKDAPKDFCKKNFIRMALTADNYDIPILANFI